MSFKKFLEFYEPKEPYMGSEHRQQHGAQHYSFTTIKGNEVSLYFSSGEIPYIAFAVNESDEEEWGRERDPEIMKGVFYYIGQYLQKENPKRFRYYPNKDYSSDNRRANIYAKMIGRYLNNYVIEKQNEDEVFLRRKDVSPHEY
jgi:hypothetical protein